jgi:hypothetical protein
MKATELLWEGWDRSRVSIIMSTEYLYMTKNDGTESRVVRLLLGESERVMLQLLQVMQY